jgi:hypothetical protein
MNPSTMTENELRAPRIFDAETLGRAFRELGVDVHEGETTVITSRWFRSGDDADLFFWLDSERRVVKQQFCLYGQVIEWNPIDGTRTGAVIEEEAGASGEDAAEVIRFDPKPQFAVVTQALSVLSFVPGLSEEDRYRLTHCLRESPKLHPKARERALKTWAPKAMEISSNQRPSFWRRLKKWFLRGA